MGHRFPVKKIARNTFSILKDTVSEFIEDKGVKLSAALAYYTIFSLPPLLILITTLAGFVFEKEVLQGSIYFQLKDMIGENSAMQIQQAMLNTHFDSNSGWATILSVIALVFGATGVFTEVQDSINMIWELKTKPKKGLIKLVLNRLLSFSMVVSLGFILMVSLVVNALIDILNQRLNEMFPDLGVILVYGINNLFLISVISVLFVTIYKVLPDARIRFREVAVGSVFTAILFLIGKFAIGFYLGNSDIGTEYGAAGSVVIILVWVYYSSIILFFGAEFTQVYARRAGRRIQPNAYAVFVETHEVEMKNGEKPQSTVIK